MISNCGIGAFNFGRLHIGALVSKQNWDTEPNVGLMIWMEIFIEIVFQIG